MSEAKKCPLPAEGTFCYEDEIPYDCKDCLKIILDGEPSEHDGNPDIGVPYELDYPNCVPGDSDCESEEYYWVTGIARSEKSKRLIEMSAECDDCGNYVLNQFIAVCRVEKN